MAAASVGSVHATVTPFVVSVMDDSVPVRLARHALKELHSGPDELIVPDITCSQLLAAVTAACQQRSTTDTAPNISCHWAQAAQRTHMFAWTPWSET